MNQFTIISTNITAGWFDLTFEVDNQQITISGSYLTDAISDLVKSTILICEGVKATDCIWKNEPGEIIWHFIRVEQAVNITVTYRNFNNEHNTFETEQLISFNTEIIRFARQVKSTIHKLFNNYPNLEYQDAWRHSNHYALELLERLGGSFDRL